MTTTKFNQAEARKEINAIGKKEGFIMRKQKRAADNTALYLFENRNTQQILIENMTFWVAYENAINADTNILANNQVSARKKQEKLGIISDVDAVVRGLVLAVTAPTNEQSQQALDLVSQLTASMNELEVSSCKKQADIILQGMNNAS
tara:strand:- start:219 stop:662 length:444 start_codon:yes stop_codon:yes gene_type:complete